MRKQYSPEELSLLAQLSPSMAAAVELQQTSDAAVRDHEQNVGIYYRPMLIEGYKIKQDLPRPQTVTMQWNRDSDDPQLVAYAAAITVAVNAFLARSRRAMIAHAARRALRDDPETLDIQRRKGRYPYNQLEPDDLYESIMAEMHHVEYPTFPACPIEAMYRAAMKRSIDEDRFVIEDDDRIPLEFEECITHTLEPHEYHVLFAER
jgi:hypothetical protein